MKQFYKVISIFCVVYVLGVILFAMLTKDTDSLDVDTVKLNDITQKVDENFDSLQSLDSENFGVGFVVLGNDNNHHHHNMD